MPRAAIIEHRHGDGKVRLARQCRGRRFRAHRIGRREAAPGDRRRI